MSKGPPPEYSLPPQPSIGAPQTIVMQNVPTQRVFGPNPQVITCPSCHHQVTTNVQSESSTKTHIIAVLLCGFCCCCIPYCIDSCQNRNHYCPSCGTFLGAYKN